MNKKVVYSFSFALFFMLFGAQAAIADNSLLTQTFPIGFYSSPPSRVNNCSPEDVFQQTFTAPFDAKVTLTASVDDYIKWNGKPLNPGKGILDGMGKRCDTGFSSPYITRVKKGASFTVGLVDTYGVNSSIDGTVRMDRDYKGLGGSGGGSGNGPSWQEPPPRSGGGSSGPTVKSSWTDDTDWSWNNVDSKGNQIFNNAPVISGAKINITNFW